MTRAELNLKILVCICHRSSHRRPCLVHGWPCLRCDNNTWPQWKPRWGKYKKEWLCTPCTRDEEAKHAKLKDVYIL